MRKFFNKLVKKDAKVKKTLDGEVLASREYRTLAYMNIMLNILDKMENELEYDPLDGEELYIFMKFQIGAFVEDLLEKIGAKVESKDAAQAT